jgi:hypothetical protein
MDTVQGLGRIEFGVRFVVCDNAEVIGLRTVGQDQSGNGWKEEARAAAAEAARIIDLAGFDYKYESNFRAYNGGSRQSLVDAVFFSAEIDDDGVRGPWSEERYSEVPASMRARANAISAKAHAGIDKIMEAASKAQDSAQAGE